MTSANVQIPKDLCHTSDTVSVSALLGKIVDRWAKGMSRKFDEKV